MDQWIDGSVKYRTIVVAYTSISKNVVGENDEWLVIWFVHILQNSVAEA